MPSFGGGMWSAVYLAHHLKLRPLRSWTMLSAGSLAGFAVVFGIVHSVADAVRIVKGIS
jgi:hypothetical protein